MEINSRMIVYSMLIDGFDNQDQCNTVQVNEEKLNYFLLNICIENIQNTLTQSLQNNMTYHIIHMSYIEPKLTVGDDSPVNAFLKLSMSEPVDFTTIVLSS